MKDNLNDIYENIIRDALLGKDTKKLEKELYTVLSSEVGIDLKKLSTVQQKQAMKTLEKFDKKLVKQIETDLVKDLKDGEYTQQELKKEVKKIDGLVDKQKTLFEIEAEKFLNFSKTKKVVPSNGITLRSLQNSTFRLNENRKKNNQVKDIKIVSLKYDSETELFSTLLKVQSLSKNNIYYDVTYQFYERTDITDNIKNSFEFKDTTTKKEYVIDKPIETKTGVSLSCTCEDYLYTFGYINEYYKCFYGILPNNFKKLPKERNPKNHIGMCRHLLTGITYLKSKNIID